MKNHSPTHVEILDATAYTVYIKHWSYVHTLSNFYKAPIIDLSQTNKRMLFHTPLTSQTSIPDHGGVTLTGFSQTNALAHTSPTNF